MKAGNPLMPLLQGWAAAIRLPAALLVEGLAPTYTFAGCTLGGRKLCLRTKIRKADVCCSSWPAPPCFFALRHTYPTALAGCTCVPQRVTMHGLCQFGGGHRVLQCSACSPLPLINAHPFPLAGCTCVPQRARTRCFYRTWSAGRCSAPPAPPCSVAAMLNTSQRPSLMWPRTTGRCT